MDLSVDRSRTTPLREQIAQAIRQRIEDGSLAPGEQLLPGRELAEQLRVNRATVLQSLRDLQDEGWIESGVGRGTFVRGTPTLEQPAAIDWTARLGALPGATLGTLGADDADRVRLSRAVAHPSLFPHEAIAEAYATVARREGPSLYDYPGPAGYEPLRLELRRRLERDGFDLSRDEVVIVNGSQQGLDLVARLLLRSAPPVLTSRPTFSGALDVFRGFGSDVVGADFDQGGLCIDSVTTALNRRRMGLLYTIPDCHNPTGVSLAAERRDALLDAARRHQVPVLEDDWLGALREEQHPRPLKALDGCAGNVLYLNTFSKVLAPGLRVGWLLVPRDAFPHLLDLKRRTDLATALPCQAVVLELLQNGVFDAHVQTVREAFDARRDVVDDMLARAFPPSIRPLGPHRGMVTWLSLPASVDVHRVVAMARQRGVDVTTGDPFQPDADGAPGLRIVHANAPADALAPALETLGHVFHEVLADGRATAGAPPLV